MPINKEYVPIDNQPTIKPRTVTGIFTRYIAKTLPLAFDESMSYYECLCALLEYINTKVIPALDNNAAGLLELQEFYEELQTYVNDYFKNLDVQEEINNKLDEMAESGQLTDIIAQYLGLAGMIAFDSVADMKQATNLVNGSKCHTLGYASVNDGGQAVYKIRQITNDDVIDEGSIIAVYDNLLVAEIVPINNKINVIQFGAKGDGINDDTTAIQNTINYGFKNGYDISIPSTDNFYKTTLPLIAYSENREPITYWQANGTHLYGSNISRTRIVKIGTATLSNSEYTDIQNVNATLICYSENNENKGTGIILENITLENYENISKDKVSGSWGLWTNVSRSTYQNLNIIAYSGIRAMNFSCNYENIVFSVIEQALYLNTGTSNFFRFLYAPGSLNPYKIISSYSTLENVCCDSGKGTIFEVGGIGLGIVNCGCESPEAQYIFKITDNWNDIRINNFTMYRQKGDTENSIPLNQCAVVYCGYGSVMNIDGLSIIESEYIDTTDGNSCIFYPVGTTSTYLSTFLKNLKYTKNYSGNNIAPLLLWGNRPASGAPQRFESQVQTFNYMVTGDNQVLPYIGGSYNSNANNIQGGNLINENNRGYSKTIWLDCKTKYTNENNKNIQYTGNHNKGDVQLYNDPLSMNALGLATVEMTSDITWETRNIPLVLAGLTTDRPTQNLYVGLQYYDQTLAKPIWWTGASWRDSQGNAV